MISIEVTMGAWGGGAGARAGGGAYSTCSDINYISLLVGSASPRLSPMGMR